MKYCDSCRFADDNQQAAGTAICRKRAPQPVVIPNQQGQVATLGVFPPVRLKFDWCDEHDDSEPRRRIHLAHPDDIPGEN